MKRFLRFTALVALAAFLGLSAAETFHSHKAHQTSADCPVCQVAHRTPAIVTATVTAAPHIISTTAHVAALLPTCVQFVSVSHGLSPPVL